MGCVPSRSRSAPVPTEDVLPGKISPKIPFDLDSRCGKCTSSLASSIEVKSSDISSSSPSSPAGLPHGDVEATKVERPPLEIPTEDINKSIKELPTAIYDYDSLTMESGERSISELNAILELVSENSLVYTKLEIMRSHLASLYREKFSLSKAALTLSSDKLPSLWNLFANLEEEGKRHMARTQRPASPLMQIFAILSSVRILCDVQREVDKKIEQKIGSQFDDILGNLKDLGAQEAALKWRVLEMMVSQRRKEGDVRVDSILEYRMRVSGLLIGAVEDLAEDDSWLDTHSAAFS